MIIMQILLAVHHAQFSPFPSFYRVLEVPSLEPAFLEPAWRASEGEGNGEKASARGA